MVRAAAIALAVTGCSHWPWHHPPPPAPAPVHELDIEGSTGAASFPQYWQRNTLVVDLSSVRGSGSIVLRPVQGTSWPVRIALRVTPGAIGVLDVRAAERQTFPITTAGVTPVDLELAPGVYTAKSTEITVSWGASGA